MPTAVKKIVKTTSWSCQDTRFPNWSEKGEDRLRRQMIRAALLPARFGKRATTHAKSIMISTNYKHAIHERESGRHTEVCPQRDRKGGKNNKISKNSFI